MGQRLTNEERIKSIDRFIRLYLHEHHQIPSNSEVQRHVGGSLSHISPRVSQWRSDLQNGTVSPIEIPEDVERSAKLALIDLWRHASSIAQSNHESERRRYEDSLAAAQAEYEVALNEIEGLKKALEENQQTTKKMNAELLSAGRQRKLDVTEISKLRQENARLHSENAMLERQNHDLKEDIKEQRDKNNLLQGELLELVKRPNQSE